MFKKLSKKKWIIIISICFILFLLGDGIYSIITFSSTQEDLVGKSIGEINEIRSKVIASSFDIRKDTFSIYTIYYNIYTNFTCNYYIWILSNKGLFLYKLSILLNPPNIKEIQRENIKMPTILIVAITANLNFVLFSSLL